MNEWIKIKDRLPELDTSVLVYTEVVDIDDDKYNAITTGHRFVNYTKKPVFVANLNGFIKNEKITHWMLLPKEPNE